MSKICEIECQTFALTASTDQCGKMKNLLSAKKFRQINYLVISLVKPLLSRKFFHTSYIQCFKSSRANLCEAILLYYTIISEQACSELAKPNFKQKLFLKHTAWYVEC